jgi:hypothetical protein
MMLLPDKGTPAIVAKGLVKPISHFKVNRSPNLKSSAIAKPNKRARSCFSAGNLLATIAMKTTLSMPKTISIAASAINAAIASMSLLAS